MMTQFKKTLALILITVLITAAATHYLFESTPQADVGQAKQVTKTIKQEQQAIDISYKAAFQKLQKENDSLKKAVQSHKAALVAANEKVSVLQGTVSQLADKVSAEPDTVKVKAEDCDSLSKETVALVKQVNEDDSLCKETVDALTAQVAEKDTTINDCNKSYVSMKQVLDTALQQQQNLTQELNALNKHIRRKAFQNKLLAVGIMILTGVSTTLLLEQKL